MNRPALAWLQAGLHMLEGAHLPGTRKAPPLNQAKLFQALIAGVFLAAISRADFAEKTARFETCQLDQDFDSASVEVLAKQTFANALAVNPAPFEIAAWLQLALTDSPGSTLEHYALGLRLLETLRQPNPDKALAPDMTAFRDIIALMSASTDWRVKLTAAELAGELRDPQLAELLARLVNDPDWPVRQRTIQALGRLGSGRNIETLMAVLAQKDEGHWFERECATQALGDCDNMAGLIVALADPKEEVRRMAVRQLGRQAIFDAKTRLGVDNARRQEKNKAIKAELKSLLDRK